MKLRQGEMLSNFEIEGFWKEVQMTMEKRLGQAPGAPGKVLGELPEAPGGVLEASGERFGGGGGGRKAADTILN